jgi:hypothetical protein
METITQISDCDFWLNKNDVEPNGFDATLSREHMIGLAVLNRCPLIVKNGLKAKWYLKGRGKTRDEILKNIEKHRGKLKRNHVIMTFVDLQIMFV